MWFLLGLGMIGWALFGVFGWYGLAFMVGLVLLIGD